MKNIDNIVIKAIRKGVMNENQARAIIAAVENVADCGYNEIRFGTLVGLTIKELLEDD